MTRFARLLAAGACALLTPAALSYAQPGERAAVFADLNFIPADVDSVFVVRDARLHRQRPIGKTLATVVDQFFSLPRTRAAWEELAGMLSMEGDVAFDEILGQRIVFVERDGADENSGDEWTIVCDVRKNVADELRRKLKAAPRRILEGVPVLAIEEGRFEMAVIRHGAIDRVILAPDASFNLMRETARLLKAGKGDAFMATDAAKRLQNLGDGVAVFWRSLAPEDEHAGEWLGGVVEVRGFQVSARVVIHSPEAPAHVPATSLELFESLKQGSLLAIVETLDPEVLAKGPAGDGPLAFVQKVTNDLLARAGADRYALVIRARNDKGITAAIGVRTDDAVASAPDVDDLMNDVLMMVAGQVGLGAWDFDFAGVQPRAERVADLSEASGRTFALLGDERLNVAWGAHAEDWWVASLPGEAGHTLREAIDAETNEVLRRWLVVGSVRPGLLLDTLAGSMPGWNGAVPSPISALMGVDEITWTAWKQGDEEVWARLEIRVPVP